MNHTGTQTIETERLILRQFKTSDAPHMFDWASDSEVAKYLTWPPHENVEFTKKLLGNWSERYEKDNYYMWCMELKESSQVVGYICACKVIDYIEMVEIAYCLSRKYWNNGLMTETLQAIIDYFFNKVKVNRIQATHDVNNPASGRVMLKCGMKYEGTHIQADLNQQGLCDICVYGLGRRDWK